MSAVTIVGIVASIASMASFAPQAWKVIRTRKTDSLSAPAYTLTVSSFATWTVYGILLGAWPIVITNAVCLVLAAFILMMKLLSRRNRDAVADAITTAGSPRPR